MCGIAGIISNVTSSVNETVLSAMGNSLAHRGPDGKATWINDDGTAGFSHNRLAVIDRSPAAAQPMHYLDRYTIIYNGEIYNYPEIKKELIAHGYKFTTSSDTEVILAAFAHYKEECVQHFDGMFAFAIWDEKEKTLFCARDRFGEKPFYYSENNGLYFASEIKALEAAGIKRDTDKGMLLLFLASGNTTDASDSSRTFSRGIKKLPASHWLKYDLRSSAISIKKYWDVSTGVSPVSLRNALERFHELFTTSIKRRLRSDVPLGTSLSGGLDSSSIAAILSGLPVHQLKTFTASFPGFEKDETSKAKKVAAMFRFLHYTVEPTAKGLISDFEKLAYHQDEPFASGSVYAQFRVFELAARNGVTVLLDGQGADEILGGYDHYRTWRFRTLFPEFTSRRLKQKLEQKIFTDTALNKDFVQEAIKELTLVKPVVNKLNDLLYFHTFSSGLEELLRYADRNSMAHGREVRLPYLNHDLVSFIFSLPASYKIHRGYTKWILRKLMNYKLPSEIVWTKRKTGFEPPQKSWMNTKLVQAYIMESKAKLVEAGILDKVVLDQQSSSHEAFDKDAREWKWMSASAFVHKKGV